MVQQTSLFPIDIVIEEPYFGTKDMTKVGWDAANVKYALKSERDGPLIPLVEWVCYQLSKLCGVITPGFDIVRCIDGHLALGIRWVDDATQLGDPHLSVASTLVLLQQHTKQISACLALDEFLSNPDRHVNNFLFIQRGGNSQCYSIDYSRAGPRMYQPPMPPFGTWPIPPNALTHKIKPLLDGCQPDSKETAAVKAALKAIPSSTFQTILDAAPDQWFTLVTRPQMMTWWDTDTARRF